MENASSVVNQPEIIPLTNEELLVENANLKQKFEKSLIDQTILQNKNNGLVIEYDLLLNQFCN